MGFRARKSPLAISEGTAGMCLHPDVIDALAAAGATPQMIAAAYRAAWAAERGEAAPARETVNLAAPARAAEVSDQIVEVNEKVAIEARRAADRARQQRSRAAKCASKAQIDMFPVTIASVTSERDGRDTPSVTDPPQVSPQVSLREISNPSYPPSSPSEVGGGTRATPLVLISPEAASIADEVAVIAGLDPTDRQATPSGWCGAAAWAEARLAHFPRETILAGARTGMASKRDGPPESPWYFDKPIARVHLKLTAPIPLAPEVSYARVREQSPQTDWQSRRDKWHAARDELAAVVASYGGG